MQLKEKRVNTTIPGDGAAVGNLYGYHITEADITLEDNIMDENDIFV